LSRLDVTTATDLNDAIARAKDAVDRSAGDARGRYITVVPGQAETYTAKALEAERFLADPAPDMAKYPMISAEMQAMGYPDGTSAANAILTVRAQWMALGAQIEQIRLKAKRDIEAATTIQQVAQIRHAAVQQLEGL